MEFDTFLQISQVVETLFFFFLNMFNRTTHRAFTSRGNLAEFASWKILNYIFRKLIELTSIGPRMSG